MMQIEEMDADLAQQNPAGKKTTPPATPTPEQRPASRQADGWAAVVRALNEHYHEPDIDGARALYAAVAAHDLDGQPVWPMAVAPPSSMKTEIVRALEGLPRIHTIDAVTPKTFISGQIRDASVGDDLPPSSLLHRIGPSGIVLCPDFSTILAIKSDDRKAIMSDLRRIYDGQLKKEFGTADVVPAWKGRLTFVACVTPDIDNHYKAIQSLGDRFVMIRWSRAGEEAAFRAMTQDIGAARAALSEAVHNLFKSLSSDFPAVAETFLRRLSALAEFTVRSRSHVNRTAYGDKAILGEPEPESAPRLAQELCQLSKGSARLFHRTDVSEEDFAVARRVAFDCIPARRRVLLEWAIDGGRISRKRSTTKYDAEDLEALGLAERDELSDLAKRLIRHIDGKEDFTRNPPNASEKTNRGPGGGGTSREGGSNESNGEKRWFSLSELLADESGDQDSPKKSRGRL
jgi:hypothetical protein